MQKLPTIPEVLVIAPRLEEMRAETSAAEISKFVKLTNFKICQFQKFLRAETSAAEISAHEFAQKAEQRAEWAELIVFRILY